MRVTLVVATDRRGLIGKDGALPWRLPADLAHFKRATMGRPVVMGRATHDSIGRPLPGRENLVLTRNTTFVRDGCRMVHGVSEALDTARDLGAEELMVIGGAEVYEAFLPRADRVLRTLVEAELQGDRYFPPLDEREFQLVAEEQRSADERNAYALRFQEWQRIQATSNPTETPPQESDSR